MHLNYCKDTIPLRPINVFGLAYERSLTIWFVESGLEKCGFGRGAMFRPRFKGSSYRERGWVWMFKPYGVASIEIGLLVICPRTIEVSPHSPMAGFFYVLHVLLGCFHPWSSLFSRWDPSPLDSLTSSFILACIRCPSSTCRVNLYKTDICPISPIPELLGMVGKAEKYGLSGAAHWTAMRVAFPDILRFSFKFGPIPGLPFFFWWGFGSAEDWVVLGCITKTVRCSAL